MEDEQAIPTVVAEAIEAGIPATKAYRIYNDTSIPELADAARLEPGRICLIEAGFGPTHAEASAIGEALDIPTDHLLP